MSSLDVLIERNHIYANNELLFQNLSQQQTMADETFEEDRKLFVGGLPQECSQDDLKVCRLSWNNSGQKFDFLGIF